MKKEEIDSLILGAALTLAGGKVLAEAFTKDLNKQEDKAVGEHEDITAAVRARFTDRSYGRNTSRGVYWSEGGLVVEDTFNSVKNEPEDDSNTVTREYHDENSTYVKRKRERQGRLAELRQKILKQIDVYGEQMLGNMTFAEYFESHARHLI